MRIPTLFALALALAFVAANAAKAMATADPVPPFVPPISRIVPVLPVVPFGAGTVAAPGGAASMPTASPRWAVLTQDITLARTLERWAAQAGYRVKWDAQRNFLIGAPDSYDGSFEAALQSVLGSAGIRASDYPLEACIYANTPPLVRITRQGEQARECGAP